MSGMTRAVRVVKRGGLALIGGGLDAGLWLMPRRVRAMLVDRAAFVQPLDYPKRRILLHVDSELEYRVRVRSVAKEPNTVRWIEESFRDGDVFYDIGANVGAYTLIAAQLFEGRVKVCAFEPSALNYSQLVRNLALNRCGDTVMPLPVALADRTGPEVFNYQNVVAGGALHALGSTATEEGATFVPALSQHLQAYSLDDVTRHLGLPAPSHLKIDVDGGELRILAGARQTLARPSLRTVLIEASTNESINVRIGAALEEGGLRLQARQPMPGGFSNLLFSRIA
jgi:FkbM family methyltransferase